MQNTTYVLMTTHKHMSVVRSFTLTTNAISLLQSIFISFRFWILSLE